MTLHVNDSYEFPDAIVTSSIAVLGAGITPNTSTLRNALTTLRTLGLISTNGGSHRASDTLMETL